MSISRKLFKGAAWNAMSQFGSQAINLVILIILARLLEPREFGIVGMVAIFTAFFGYFTEFGFTPSLLKEKSVDDLDYCTVFWSTLVFAGLVYVGVYFAAPFVAVFYQTPELVPITRVLFITFLFSPLAFIPEVIEQRQISYQKIAAADLVALVVSGVLGVSLAFAGFGVWSLVFQQVSMTAVRGPMLLMLTGWRPKLSFSMQKFKKLSGFGMHFTIQNLVTYFLANIDGLLVGKFLGPAALGVYNLALRISKYFTLKLYFIFGRMLFPTFSTFQDDLGKVRRNLLKVSLGGGILAIPFFTILFFGAEAITQLFFGDKWMEAVPIIRVLVFYLFADSLSIADESIAMLYGRIRTVNAIKIFLTLILLVAGPFAIRAYGMMGMAVLFASVSFLNNLIVKCITFRLVKIPVVDYLRTLKVVGVMGVALFSAGSVYTYLLGSISPLLFLIGEGIFIVCIFFFIALRYQFLNIRNKTIQIDSLIHNTSK